MTIIGGDLSSNLVSERSLLGGKKGIIILLLLVKWAPWTFHWSNLCVSSFSLSYSPGAQCGQAALHEAPWTKGDSPDINIITPQTKHPWCLLFCLDWSSPPLVIFMLEGTDVIHAIKASLCPPRSSNKTHFTLVLAPWVIGTFGQLAIGPEWQMSSPQRSTTLDQALC